MLRIDFSITPEVQAALKESGTSDSSTFAVAITIQNETLKLLAPPISTSGSGLNEDLKAARKVLEAKNATSAYVVVRSSPTSQSVVVYVSDNASAKERMLYSTGTSRVVGATPHAQKRTVQISSIAELLPSLFDADSRKVHEDLMTESERHQAAIARMELAPQPVALPGVETKITAEADTMLAQFARGDVDVATFRIAGGQLQLDKTVSHLGGDLEAVVAVLPKADPRFIVLRYPSPKTQRPEWVMVYVCPPTCSLKTRMQYASSAAAFRERASRHEIKFAHKIETDTPATLIEDVCNAFEPFPGAENGAQVESRPHPPAPHAMKGHRMLI